MAGTRTVRVLGVGVETAEDEHGRSRSERTGNVSLNVIPEWMARETITPASLTPAEARHLALELLQAAESAER